MVACISLELRLQGIPLLVFEFDCLKFGPGGLTIVKPGGGKLELPPAMSALLAAAVATPAENRTDLVTESPSEGVNLTELEVPDRILSLNIVTSEKPPIVVGIIEEVVDNKINSET